MTVTGIGNTSMEVDERKMTIRSSVRSMTHASVFAALMGVCAWISLPVADIAFTLQTLGVFLALGILGGRWGSVSILIYLLLGAVGLPVFSGFRGGPGMLLGITGGYLWGFLVSGLLYWAFEKAGKLPGMVIGMLGCYLTGSFWFYLHSGGGLGFILLRCVVPYLIPDGIKIFLALALSRRLAGHIGKT